MTSDNTVHRRHNPLNNSWVLVSPHRTKRPWQGQEETPGTPQPDYDPDCYLCPGNQRAQGQSNPQYTDVFVFDNDFPGLLDTEANTVFAQHELLRGESVRGVCRVICYHPQHNLTLSQMSLEQIDRVIQAWVQQHAELSQRFAWVQIFENRGATMGCSNPHPHGQIWATSVIPQEGQRESDSQRQYFEKHKRELLQDYLELEIAKQERVLIENDSWLVVVPYWASWPFETLIISRDPYAAISDLSQQSRQQLAVVLKTLMQTYDGLFDTPFPYSMGWHSAPAQQKHAGFRLHAHVYPPLLRSATIRKFQVGYEMLAEPQRDLTPESACELLIKSKKKVTT